jgi:uncharacterized protein involved in exopolysaccharide biosynthesis
VEAGTDPTGLAGGSAPNLTDVPNSQLIQRLAEQQVALRSEMAEAQCDALPQHPRMRALAAQIVDLDRQIAAEAGKILDSVEAEAKLAAGREVEIEQTLAE